MIAFFNRKRWLKKGIMGLVVVLLIEAIQTISSLFIFFDEKILRAQKHVMPTSLCMREKLLSLLFSVSLFLFC